MNQPLFRREHRIPVLSYLFLILSIFILGMFLDSGTVFSLSAALMLVIPFLLGKNRNYFAFNYAGFVKGALITFGILAAYLLVFLVYGFLTDKGLGFREAGFTFFIIQFLLVAIPEEVFFRGYLQEEFGNNYRAIIIVSLLFAVAHLLLVCAMGGGVSVCIQNGLTFFPSLVMGYLYMKTGTLWSSILFHCLANILHILIQLG